MTTVRLLWGGLSGEEPHALRDDTGAMPMFSLPALAETCAQVLGELRPSHDAPPLVACVEVRECSQEEVASALLNGRSPQDLAPEEVDAVALAAYLFEATRFDLDDALLGIPELAASIARGEQRRIARGGDTT